MEKTLVIIKPGAIQRELIGEIITRFERKGLHLCGIKMYQFTDKVVLNIMLIWPIGLFLSVSRIQ